VDYGIVVASIEECYSKDPWHEVIILNEYDILVLLSPEAEINKRTLGA
jgi:hypothetical protein